MRPHGTNRETSRQQITDFLAHAEFGRIRRNMMHDKPTPPKKGPGRPRLPERVQVKVRIPPDLAGKMREYQEIRQELREMRSKRLFSLNDVYTMALKYWWRKRGKRYLGNYREQLAAMRGKEPDR
jgi:hypothetical protein